MFTYRTKKTPLYIVAVHSVPHHTEPKKDIRKKMTVLGNCMQEYMRE